MALASQPRAFFRTGVEEEEITPPCKQRSFDSLSVAHILQAKLDTSEPAGGFGEGGFGRSSASATSPAASSSPGSPSIGDAAALLSRVQAGSTLDNAADCLLSLAMLSGGGHDMPRQAPPSGGRGAMKPPKLPSTSKRPHASMKGSNKTADPSQTNAARRRLKMAKPAADGFGDAAAQNASPQAGGIEGGAASAPPRSAARGSGGAAATKGRSNGGGRAPKTQRPRSLGAGQAASTYGRAQQHAQQHQMAAYYMADAGAAAVSNNTFTVSGVSYPIRLLSGASLEQLKCLSVAFQLCPQPNPQQIAAIAQRVGLSSEKLETWFQSRRTLQDWMLQQPRMVPADLASMFYPDEAQASRSASSLAGAAPGASGGDSSSATVTPPPPAHGVAGAANLAAEWQVQAA